MKPHLTSHQQKDTEMNPLIRLSYITLAALSLVACANRPQQRAVWEATPTASIPQDQAEAMCRFSIRQNGAAFDQLSLVAGQPMLSEFGWSLYKDCMLGQGYRFGGMAPVGGVG